VELNYFLDTNIILYYLGGKLVKPLPNGKFTTSFVTQIELLSYSNLQHEEEIIIKKFLKKIQIVGVNEKIINLTIALRKKHKIKTPDAIIAATAIAYDSCILSNDLHLKRLPEVRCKSLTLK
jgi:hypothetical protein